MSEKPQSNTFLGARGDAEVKISFRELYLIAKYCAKYAGENFDPGAVGQNVCVGVEKKMGIYPNLIFEVTPTRHAESVVRTAQTIGE